jgi:uroporphyrinogen decarboxylase
LAFRLFTGIKFPVNARERFLAAAACLPSESTPLWIMRQAGRYLPEYRTLRARRSFAEMIHTPELAAEVTLQPVRRFGFDAAIVFSDIMAVPEAMGVPYEIVEGSGVVTGRRIASKADAADLCDDPDFLREKLSYVAEALRFSRRELGTQTALLGFAGSPWTLACYLAEGRGAKGGAFTKALELSRENPEAFALLMEKLSQAVAAHLALQIEAGADAVQIFDSWAAAAPADLYGELSLKWIARIVAALPKGAPVILFAKDAPCPAAALASTGAGVISLSDSVPLRAAADSLPANVAVQGNLSPDLPDGSPEAAYEATTALLASMKGRAGHILNLGHGIHPEARLESVAAIAAAARDFS